MSQTKFNKLKKNLLMKHRSEEKNNSEQTEVRISKVFHFRTSDYFNIHKYCDYFVSIIVEIQKIRSQEFQSVMELITHFAASILAPFDRSNSTTAVCPLEAAIIRAVFPSYKTAEELIVSW